MKTRFYFSDLPKLFAVAGLTVSMLLLTGCSKESLDHVARESSKKAIVHSSPQVVSIVPNMINCDGPCVVGNVKVNGSDFALGQRVSINHGKLLDARLINSSELLISLSFDTLSFSPGSIRLTVSSPAGPSSGAYISFAGSDNLGRSNQGEAYFLDQETNTVRVFDLREVHGPGPAKPKRSCFVGASFASDFAVYNKNGLVIAKPNSMVLMRPSNCQIIRVVGLWPNRAGSVPSHPKSAR